MKEEEEDWDKDIKGKERLFVLNFCTSELYFMNQRQAYIAAFTKTKKGKLISRPTEESADVCASRLMKKPEIKKAIVKLLKLNQPENDQSNSYKLLHDLVLQATYNPSDIINEQGMLKTKTLEELGDLAKCIEYIQPSKFGYIVRLASRRFAQDKLLKYYDLVRETPDIQATLPVIMLQDKETIENWNAKEE